MNKSLFRTVTLVLLAGGLLLVLASVSLGREAAHSYLRAQGGSMDSAQFVVMLQEYIHTYLWLGGIVSLLGGFGFIKTLELR